LWWVERGTNRFYNRIRGGGGGEGEPQNPIRKKGTKENTIPCRQFECWLLTLVLQGKAGSKARVYQEGSTALKGGGGKLKRKQMDRGRMKLTNSSLDRPPRKYLGSKGESQGG